jgi:hypothetical protein
MLGCEASVGLTVVEFPATNTSRPTGYTTFLTARWNSPVIDYNNLLSLDREKKRHFMFCGSYVVISVNMMTDALCFVSIVELEAG